jgi:hypothetical protein
MEGDLLGTHTEYYKEHIAELEAGKKVCPSVPDYTTAVADYSIFLKGRVNARLKEDKGKDTTGTVASIPRFYRLKDRVNDENHKHFCGLSDEGKPMTEYLKKRGRTFMTALYSSPNSPFVMLSAVMFPTNIPTHEVVEKT